MNKTTIILFGAITLLVRCSSGELPSHLSATDKATISYAIQKELDEGAEATRTENIDRYMSQFPDDFIIYDESGEVISKEKQREYALRDWDIIDTTLHIKVVVDSIQYPAADSVIVFTSQRWERMMFQRDGVTTDTVLTTQRHRETWKKSAKGWFSYEVEELGGKVFINGEEYDPG
jgi:hypothetical protein